MVNKLLFFVVILILVGCSPQKRLARLLERHPLSTDTVVIVKDTTIWRDTTVFRLIPGDTIYKDTVIAYEIDIPYTELITRSTLAEATAWIFNNSLGLELIQYDSLFEFKLDSAIRVDKDSVYVEIVREIPVEIKPNLFWKHGFLVLAGLILIGLILLFLLKRR